MREKMERYARSEQMTGKDADQPKNAYTMGEALETGISYCIDRVLELNECQRSVDYLKTGLTLKIAYSKADIETMIEQQARKLNTQDVAFAKWVLAQDRANVTYQDAVDKHKNVEEEYSRAFVAGMELKEEIDATISCYKQLTDIQRKLFETARDRTQSPRMQIPVPVMAEQPAIAYCQQQL